jgi:hypothetical protein
LNVDNIDGYPGTEPIWDTSGPIVVLSVQGHPSYHYDNASRFEDNRILVILQEAERYVINRKIQSSTREFFLNSLNNFGSLELINRE